MNVRRIVTGRTSAGDGIVRDEILGSTAVGVAGHVWRIWGSDVAVTAPNDGAVSPFAADALPPGGFRYMIIAQGRECNLSTDHRDALADSRCMHMTESVDIVHVLSGEIILEMENGSRATLHAGDVVIQNGTRHTWRNESDQPAVTAVVMIGAAPPA